jgi:hypothetical protein
LNLPKLYGPCLRSLDHQRKQAGASCLPSLAFRAMVALIWRAIPSSSPANHATIIKFAKHITHCCCPTSPYTTIAMPRCSRKGPGITGAAVASQSPVDLFLQILADLAKTVDTFFWLLHPLQKESETCLEALLGINIAQLQSVLRLCGFLNGSKLQFGSLESAVNAISIRRDNCLELTKWQCPKPRLQQYYLRIGKPSIASPRNVTEQNKQLVQGLLMVPGATALSADLRGRLNNLLDMAKDHMPSEQSSQVTWSSPPRSVSPNNNEDAATPDAVGQAISLPLLSPSPLPPPIIQPSTAKRTFLEEHDIDLDDTMQRTCTKL